MTGTALVGPVDPPGLHVMSFNIRRRMPRLGPAIGPRAADRWAVRAPAVEALIASERPSILGAQEVLAEQDRALTRALGPGYHRVGHGREANGQGEGCPLYYDSTRLELLSWSQAALSDTPDDAGSRSWGNFTPRVLVQAELRDRATGTRLLAVNTHFDHISRRSRVRAARMIRELVADRGLPAIVTGDLNSGERTAPLDELFGGGTLADAWGAAEVRLTPEWGTFPNYRPPRRERKRIDWIAVTRGVRVERIGLNARRPGGAWPSDHLPVQAVVHLPDAAGTP
jgi:endonuclease/exonuclease/phosphatase family metal-dependent hydrolase